MDDTRFRLAVTLVALTLGPLVQEVLTAVQLHGCRRMGEIHAIIVDVAAEVGGGVIPELCHGPRRGGGGAVVGPLHRPIRSPSPFGVLGPPDPPCGRRKPFIRFPHAVVPLPLANPAVASDPSLVHLGRMRGGLVPEIVAAQS